MKKLQSWVSEQEEEESGWHKEKALPKESGQLSKQAFSMVFRRTKDMFGIEGVPEHPCQDMFGIGVPENLVGRGVPDGIAVNTDLEKATPDGTDQSLDRGGD